MREFKVFRNRFKSLIKEELDTLDEIFYDVDESCEMPFRECNYIKEDIEDTADLFTEEIAVEEDSEISLSKNDNSADE